MIKFPIGAYFLAMTVLIAFADLPLFSGADAPPGRSKGRVSTLDGLRGYLALGVFFSHGSYYVEYLRSGAWPMPDSMFYINIGRGAVAVFFMITGFLFWSRVIAQKGALRWAEFYIGRILRIGPVYMVGLAGSLLIVFSVPHLHAPSEYGPLRQIVPWLGLGLLPGRGILVFGPDLNGWKDTYLILCGVTWTLRYEWLFYLGLPVAALLVRVSRFHVPTVICSTVLCLIYVGLHGADTLSRAVFPLMFLFGMTTAAVISLNPPRVPDTVGSALSLICLAAATCLFRNDYSAAPVALDGAAFYFIASGSTLFGLLNARASRRLGDISYGIYLLQGLVLYAVMHIPAVKSFALGSTVSYWAAIACCGLLLIMFSTAVHVTVENPGITLGKSIAERYRSWRLQTQS